MSEERLDLTLQEAEGDNPPGMLQELTQAINQLIPGAAESGGKWLQGKGETEVAKAGEIKARALKLIGDLQNDRERLINERNTAQQKAEQENAEAAMRHREKMFELKTQRLKEAVESIVRLKDLGAEIDIRLIDKVVKEIASSVKEGRDG